MDKVKVIYGSTTGNTEAAARSIAAAFGVEPVGIADATAADFDAELLLLGCSTWGLGELQDDWAAGVRLLDAAELAGRKVALFGTGDQNGFGDTFVDALGILAAKAKARGAVIVGDTPAEGYAHSRSVAESDGRFCGLALDVDNEPGKSDERIAAWVAQLKQ